MSDPTPVEQGEDAKNLTRQRERTVDNVKRLFAVVFALSFTTVGRNAFDSVKNVVIGAAPLPAWDVALINVEMLAVFAVTASVFYHQGTKFLDWRYASGSHDEAVPLGFAGDFFVIIVTMIPFILMANSTEKDVIDKVGFTAFFFSYVLLLTQGLVLLLLSQLRSTPWARGTPWLIAERLSIVELNRDRSLRTYWLVMNSLVYLVLAIVYYIMTSRGTSCQLRIGSSVPAFLVLFGLIAMIRDVLDLGWAWPFLYPVKTPKYLWPIPLIRDRSFRIRNFEGFTSIGWALMIAGIAVAFADHWFDYHYWATTCAH